MLPWAVGAGGRGALLPGDTIQIVFDRREVSFMYSYPNLIPLAAAEVRRVGLEEGGRPAVGGAVRAGARGLNTRGPDLRGACGRRLREDGGRGPPYSPKGPALRLGRSESQMGQWTSS